MVASDNWPQRDSRFRLFATPADMIAVRFPAEFVKATVFVGLEVNDRFIPVGTGFLVNVDLPSRNAHARFVATAHHLLNMVPGEFIWVRMNRRDGGCSSVKIEKSIAFINSKNDLILLNWHWDIAIFDQQAIPLNRPEYVKQSEYYDIVDIGDEVVTVGLYSTHYGEQKNLPVVRVGNISLMPGEPVFSNRGFVTAYLVEIKSNAGLSGSPVYVNIPPAITKDGRHFFLEKPFAVPLGILIGYHIVVSKQDQIPVPVRQDEPIDEDDEDDRDSADQRNTGFAIVVPWERLLEMAESQVLLGALESAFDQRAKASARSAGLSIPVSSAGSAETRVEPIVSDENPQHREDFTSLLNAAAKTKPQGD